MLNLGIYNYTCKACTLGQAIEKDLEGPFYVVNEDKPEASELIWEERHSIHETPEIKCPCCTALATRSMWGVTFHSYTKGNGYMDKAGCHRDMNLYKLTKEDPYAHMRQPGEADDLAQKLRNAGKFGHDRHGNKTTKIWTSK